MIANDIYNEIRNTLLNNGKSIEGLSLNELINYHTILFDKSALFRIHIGKINYLEVKSAFKELIPKNYNTKELKSIPLWIKVELSNKNDINNLTDLILETYDETIGYEEFGCCSKFMECSDAKKCINPDVSISKGCLYRKNLEEGRIFYGKNANI